MTYTYDEPTQEIRDSENKKAGWASGATAAAIAIALLVALLAGDPMPPTTFLSSIPEPPAGVTLWEKGIAVDGEGQPWTPVEIVNGEFYTLTMVDLLTTTVATSLIGEWDPAVLSITAWITSGGAVDDSMPGLLVWTMAPSGTEQFNLVRLWELIGGAFSGSTVLTETLVAGGTPVVVTVELVAVTPTATPTPTLTPTPGPPTSTPTPTPGYTPIPWPEVPYPTPTPCVGFGCDPVAPHITYDVFLPLVMRDSP